MTLLALCAVARAQEHDAPKCFPCLTGGRAEQAQFGAKFGKRWNRFCLFAKARTGFVTFSKVNVVTGTRDFGTPGDPLILPVFGRARKTYFSLDAGGVLELYPSERLFTRFDFGDTMIRYGERDLLVFPLTPAPPKLPGELTHNFQFAAGLGFRF